MHELAWYYFSEESDIREAIKFARKSLRYDPSNIACLDTLAEMYYADGNTGKAVKTIRKALKIAPDNPVLNERLKKYESD